MTDITLSKSPSVYIVDSIARPLNFSSKKTTNAVPCIIGITERGPAFMPYLITSIDELEALYGKDDIKYPAVLSAASCIRAGSPVYIIKVLGAGDCNQRQTSGNNPGNVSNSGFIVGEKLINTSSGLVSSNSFAGSVSQYSGMLGRTYFLSAFMSESAGSTIFSDAGIQTLGTNVSQPIIRGVLFSPSGVILSLSSTYESNNSSTTTVAHGAFGVLTDGGSGIGSVDLSNSKQEFVMLLNGHQSSSQYPNVITASFDSETQNYFVNAFNTDPQKLQLAGHYLYTHYDIPTSFAVLTGTGILTPANYENKEPVALLLTSSLTRNTGSATTINTVGVPNFENFEDRYSPAFTPWIISQKINGVSKNLFRFHTLNDGFKSLSELKITISNIEPTKSGYYSFDIDVRSALDSDTNKNILMTFKSCNLDQNSINFICKKIGDNREYYSFDEDEKSKKIVSTGNYNLTNTLLRVEVDQDVLNGNFYKNSIPVGFRGIHHLVTSGSSFTSANSVLHCHLGSSISAGLTSSLFNKIVQPPLQFREHLYMYNEAGPNKLNSFLTWGAQYENKRNILNKNEDTKINPTVFSLGKYFPKFHTSLQNPWVGDNHTTQDISGTIFNADRFNNNLFTLERIQVLTGSSANGRDPKLPNPDYWSSATYSRNGILTSSLQTSIGDWSTKVRFVNPDFDLQDQNCRLFLKFTVPFIGGFDGLNIFDHEKSNMTNESSRREFLDSQQLGKSDSTTAAFIECLKIVEDKSNVECSILTIPGIRQNQIIDKAIQVASNRNDSLVIFDLELMNKDNLPISGSNQEDVDARYTARKLYERFINNSYASCYFPDVTMIARSGSILDANVTAPPSIPIISMFINNDKLNGIQAAPMGTVRGVLENVVDTNVKLTQEDLDFLFENVVNPIVSNKNESGKIIAISQKTTLGKSSVFDRINMRRLSLHVRRKIRKVCEQFLFEQKSSIVLNKLNLVVNSELAKMQNDKLFSRYKFNVSISEDTLNSNYYINGNIFILPNQSDDMIQIEFTTQE